MSTTWLKDLEERVQQAAARIATLREANAGLETRVAELESALAEAEQSDGASAAWREEREEIKGRVSQLVDRLAALLDDADG